MPSEVAKPIPGAASRSRWAYRRCLGHTRRVGRPFVEERRHPPRPECHRYRGHVPRGGHRAHRRRRHRQGPGRVAHQFPPHNWPLSYTYNNVCQLQDDGWVDCYRRDHKHEGQSWSARATCPTSSTEAPAACSHRLTIARRSRSGLRRCGPNLGEGPPPSARLRSGAARHEVPSRSRNVGRRRSTSRLHID